MLKVLIKNGLVIDPKNDVWANLDIYIEGKDIKEMAKKLNYEADYVVDATDMIVSPGFVDLHTNFCDPGDNSREDLKSGSLAAAKGGFTWIVLGSEHKPSTSEANVLDYITKFRVIMPVNIYPSAAVTVDRLGEEISDMQFLKNHGAVCFSDGYRPIENKELLKTIMKKAKEYNLPLAIYNEKLDKVKVRGISTGKIADSLNIKGASDPTFEDIDLEENLKLAKEIGCTLDIAYVSTKASVDKIREAKMENDNIYAEANPFNIFYTEKLYSSVKKEESLAKMLPPLRTEADRKAIIDGLLDGTIDIISSNHMPCTEVEKKEKFKDATPGAIGLESMLGLLGAKMVNPEILYWNEVIEKISVNPAKLYGLDKYGAGSIDVGNVANLTIFDPNEKWTFEKSDIISKSKNSPIFGTELCGRVKYTICNGKLVYKDKKLEEKEKSKDANK